jgi:hypothetical protein
VRTFFVVPVLALVVALGFSSPARADGGTYPSNAPTIVPGSTVSGGTTAADNDSCRSAGHAGVQYYKVALQPGDHLIADFTTVAGSSTYLCVFAPTVTDYTIGTANALEGEYTGTTKKAELQYIAPTSGDYLLAVERYESGPSWAYSMIVNVLHASTVSASGPSGVKVGHKIKVNGQANVAGSVTLQLKSGGWKTVAQGNTRADGSFKLAYKATQTGLYKFRVLFGANGYLGSKSSKVRVRVHR